MGLKNGNAQKHVDVSAAWIDLTLLSQCVGRIQQGTTGILFFFQVFRLIFFCKCIKYVRKKYCKYHTAVKK